MPSDQIWRHEVTYHPEDVQDRSNSQNLEYRVYLPDTLEKLGLEKGDKVVLEKTGSTDPAYILGRKYDGKSQANVYKIFTEGSSRLRITLPTDWIDDFIDFEGDDILVVEVNTVEDEFRIYRNDDYRKRLAEFDDDNYPRVGKPVIIALSSAVANSQDSSKTLREGFGDDIDDEGPAQ